MVAGLLALVVAAAYAGAALYINVAEQPARVILDDRSLLMQWKLAYRRGFALEAPLTVVGFIFGGLAWWQIGAWPWLLGALIMIANVPYTLIAILPTNRLILATDPAAAGPESRRLMENWAGLHAVRTGLGFAATAVFLWAALG